MMVMEVKHCGQHNRHGVLIESTSAAKPPLGKGLSLPTPPAEVPRKATVSTRKVHANFHSTLIRSELDMMLFGLGNLFYGTHAK